MPFGDRTGPMGLGPMTGRGAGYCAGFSMPGPMNPLPDRGFWGRGGGRGWRHCYYATGLPGWARVGMGMPAWGVPMYPYGPISSSMTSEQEAEILKGQAEYFGGALEEIKKRIADFESKQKEK